MSSVNKAIILGNLGKDPIVRYAPNGDCVTSITVATTETWKDKNGEKQEKVEWHRITFFRQLAEIAGKYLTKGKQVYVEGKLQTTKYTDKQGVEKYTTEIIASDMKMLGGKKDGGEREDEGTQPEPKTQRSPSVTPSGGFDDMDDDIPF